MSDPDNETQATTDPGACMPCRGTGRLISGLGGEPHEVSCSWCEGTGRRIPGLDAQQHPAESPPESSVATPAADSASGAET